MANWLKITNAQVEVTEGFQACQATIINLDAASAFTMEIPGTVSIIIDGKAYVIQQREDSVAYKNVLRYIEQRTQGQTLP